jgi:DNA (cytosine-5)-methyltransferase 1
VTSARPRAIDLFCGAGGAAMGLHRAGFDVTGIDIKPQPRYPFRFIRADALKPPVRLADFDLIWASPPCQHYSALKSRTKGETWDSIPATRSLLKQSGTHYIIENVLGSPLRRDAVLCGEMFGLQTYRHRIFECSFLVMQQPHPRHRIPHCTLKRRRSFDSGLFISVTGNVGSYVGPKCLGIDWMTGEELSQSVPPAYAEHIGRYAIMALELDGTQPD